jgi:diguanylate cyclase (GGDEF)-like protein
VNAHHDTGSTDGSGNTRVQPAGLSVLTDDTGKILHGSGRWPGDRVKPVPHITELVHPHNHDLLERMVGWLGSDGRLDEAVGVRVQSVAGWDDAVVTALSGSDGIVWSFTPVLADPMRPLVKAITDERDLVWLLDTALQGLGGDNAAVWASVHHARDADDRYRSVVSSTGRDTFRRAIEAAVNGDTACPWDSELLEDRAMVAANECGDGITLAGPRVGLATTCLIPIHGSLDADAACLALWSEGPGMLERPDVDIVVNRVLSGVTLAFQVEASRESQRTLATRDGLTGLWNRAAFFAQVERTKNHRQTAVICANVDDFRAVNDWHGHAAGDEVLAQIGCRLRQAMRPADTVARVSADEFAILCGDVAHEQAAEAIAERVLATCDADIKVGTETVAVQMSVGLALSSPERCGLALFDAAERTMIEAKHGDRGSWRLA